MSHALNPKLMMVTKEKYLGLPNNTINVTRYNGSIIKLDIKDWYMGIDPGDRNMGVAFLLPPFYFVAFQIKLNDADTVVERITDAIDVVEQLMWGTLNHSIKRACVERAAYSKLYGQVNLSENRTAAVMALMQANINDIVVPAPGSIRKVVFGKSTIKAEETWTNLGPDAASALACAFYAMETKE